jgi:hypothetical protein
MSLIPIKKINHLIMVVRHGWGDSAWRSAKCVEKSKAYTYLYIGEEGSSWRSANWWPDIWPSAVMIALLVSVAFE